jgi:hypothetical protein
VTRMGLGGRLARIGIVAVLTLSILPQAAVADQPVPPYPMVLSLTASGANPRVLTHVSGRLTDIYGGVNPGAPVLVESSIDATSWTTSETVSTRYNGVFETLHAITRTTYFRASYAGDAGTLATVSAVATAPFTPDLGWVVWPAPNVHAGQALDFKVVAAVPDHAGCAGMFSFMQDRWGAAITTVTVTGSFDTTVGGVVFSTSTRRLGPGRWYCRFDLTADAAHTAASTYSPRFVVGETALTWSYKRAVIPVGGAVKFTGCLKDALTKRGVTGVNVRLESCTDVDTTWHRIKTVKSGKGGKVTYVVHPKNRTDYRLESLGTSKWATQVSGTRNVSPYFSLSGKKGGHFTSKEFWLTAGRHVVTASPLVNHVFLVHNKNHSFEVWVPVPGPSPNDGAVDFPKKGYYHVMVRAIGKVPHLPKWTIKIWT